MNPFKGTEAYMYSAIIVLVSTVVSPIGFSHLKTLHDAMSLQYYPLSDCGITPEGKL